MWKQHDREAPADDLVALKPGPVSCWFILPPCCPWKRLSTDLRTCPLLPRCIFPLSLNYTFCHFRASSHPSIAPPLASLFLCESAAAHRSILIEVSWGQIRHSCFTIKMWTGEGGRQKRSRLGGKGWEDMLCVLCSVHYTVTLFLVIILQCFNETVQRKKRTKGEKTRERLGGRKDKKDWCKRRRSRRGDGGEEVWWDRFSGQPAVQYHWIIASFFPLMRWDLFLSSFPLLSVTFCVVVHVCVSACMYQYTCDPLRAGSIPLNLVQLSFLHLYFGVFLSLWVCLSCSVAPAWFLHYVLIPFKTFKDLFNATHSSQ